MRSARMKKDDPTSDALLAAIRAKCMNCSGNSRKLVELCNITECPLYPYRTTETVCKAEKQQTTISGQIDLYDVLAAMEGI